MTLRIFARSTMPPRRDDDPVGDELLHQALWNPDRAYRRLLARELGEHWAKRTIARIETALDRCLPRQR